MLSYLFSFFLGICLLLSFIGWGGVLNYFLFPKQRIDWGNRAAWGVAWSVLIGGILNATWTISPLILLIYSAIGLVYCLVDLVNHRRAITASLSLLFQSARKDKLALVGIVVVALLTFLQYTGWLATGRENFANMVYAEGFNTSDDYHAYLVFPHKMIQLGSMGPDPFSERRMVALGGHSFLQALTLSGMPDTYLNLVDPGLSLLIVIGILIGFFIEKKVDLRRALFMILFVLLMTVPKANATSLMMPVALFLSLFRTLDDPETNQNNFANNAFIIALLSSALCALKLTVLAATVLFFALTYACYFISSNAKQKAIAEFSLASILTVLFLLPWMISLYQSSGTLLYPLLGKGYYVGAYGETFRQNTAGLGLVKTVVAAFRGIYSFIIILLGCFTLTVRPISDLWKGSEPTRQAVLSMTTAAILATGAVGVATENADPFRYCFSHLYPAILALLMVAMTESEKIDRKVATNFFIVAIFSAGVIISETWDLTKQTYPSYVKNIAFGLKNQPLVPDRQKALYAAMQQSIPPGATVLTKLDVPFILDFKRNPIYVADWPGRASLPPGMPLRQGGEALAAYLKTKSIRYLAYSQWSLDYPPIDTSDTANFSSVFIHQGKLAHDFRDSVKQLESTRKVIYKDGENFVMDLEG